MPFHISWGSNDAKIEPAYLYIFSSLNAYAYLQALPMGSTPVLSREGLQKVSIDLSDVVVDHAQWPRMLDAIAAAAGSIGAAVLPLDPDGACFVSPSLKATFERYFADGWHLRDIRRRAVPLQLQGRIAADDDIVSDDEIRTDPYYAEYLPTTGTRWWAGLGFRAGPSMYCLALQRTELQGRFTPDEKAVLQSLLVRFNEVGSLAWAIGRAALAGAVDALGSLQVAAFSVDRNGKVVGANAAADCLFCRDIGIRNGRIAIRDHATAAGFERLLLRLKHLPKGRSFGAEILVVRRDGASTILLKALPIDGAARHPFAGAAALFAMAEVKPPSPLDPLLVGRALGLTPAESKLAARMATGEALDDAADLLGVAKETARNQLKSVFSKTDTHRQGQLIALLSAFPKRN